MGVRFRLALIAAAVHKVPYAVEAAAFDMVRRGLQPVLILTAVGALIAAWTLPGRVPTMIYLGVKLIEPAFSLSTALVLCAITSFVSGTNFGTVRRVQGPRPRHPSRPCCRRDRLLSHLRRQDGARLRYHGPRHRTLGSPPVRHIRPTAWTNIPAIVTTLVVFVILGFGHRSSTAAGEARIDALAATVSNAFVIGWIPLIPPVLVLAL
ncbi:hypothetical protein FB381_2602 [Nocardioides albertanoniae]|uniref:Uncharacterized protein n=1 Tax=Nocardioides albertanoniae TaxID=1175486 RepID=A0A543A891_9ACTN|nr:hypothetical protein FB381_2602 [Nocardioides albertanoniae]